MKRVLIGEIKMSCTKYIVHKFFAVFIDYQIEVPVIQRYFFESLEQF